MKYVLKTGAYYLMNINIELDHADTDFVSDISLTKDIKYAKAFNTTAEAKALNNILWINSAINFNIERVEIDD